MGQHDYAEIKGAVEKAGFYTSFQPFNGDEDVRWLIVLVSRCTAGRLHGNSFRLLLEDGQWHLITWSPVEYLVPADADLTALCLECLHASSVPIPVVPPDIAGRYGLVKISEAKFDRE